MCERTELKIQTIRYGSLQQSSTMVTTRCQKRKIRAVHEEGALDRGVLNGPPKDYVCPITLELMLDPVVAADGYTYERKAIEEWFENNRTSPNTNAWLEDRTLRPNHSMRGQIITWKQHNQGDVGIKRRIENMFVDFFRHTTKNPEYILEKLQQLSQEMARAPRHVPVSDQLIFNLRAILSTSPTTKNHKGVQTAVEVLEKQCNDKVVKRKRILQRLELCEVSSKTAARIVQRTLNELTHLKQRLAEDQNETIHLKKRLTELQKSVQTLKHGVKLAEAQFYSRDIQRVQVLLNLYKYISRAPRCSILCKRSLYNAIASRNCRANVASLFFFIVLHSKLIFYHSFLWWYRKTRESREAAMLLNSSHFLIKYNNKILQRRNSIRRRKSCEIYSSKKEAIVTLQRRRTRTTTVRAQAVQQVAVAAAAAVVVAILLLMSISRGNLRQQTA